MRVLQLLSAAVLASALACSPAKETSPQPSLAPENSDVVPIDRPTPAGSGCADGSLCLDFEQIETLDSLAAWQEAAPNCKGTGRIALDKSFAHGGHGSLRIDGQGGYCNHIFLGLKTAPWPLAVPLHIRFFIALDKPLTDSHITLATLHDQIENKDIRLGGQSKILMWNRESDDATLPELSPQGIAKSLSLTAKQWYCVSYVIDPKEGTLITKVDDKAIPGLEVDAIATPDVDGQWLRKVGYRPQPTDLKLGYESYGGDANTVWYDDLRIATENLDCSS